MTREELDFIGALNMCDEISNEAYKKIMCHCEEQEPCDPVISHSEISGLIYLYLRGEKFEITRQAIEAVEAIKKQKSKPDKALKLIAEWAIECGFGYDNIPGLYEIYKDDIADMGYTEGLAYIAQMESEG